MEKEREKQILEAIRQQQLELLQDTFLSLLTASYSAPREYIKLKTNPDYQEYFEEMVKVFKFIDAKNPIIANKYEEMEETPEQSQAMIELYAEILEHLFRVDYHPPSDPWKILIHLQTLNRLLLLEKPDISISEAVLSLNYAKLLAAASAMKAHQITKDSRALPMSAGSTKTRKAKAQGKQETVLRIYRLLKKTNSFRKMTLNAVAKAIKNNWDKIPPPGSEKSPGLTTIKDYLKQDPQIMGELKD